MTRDELLTLCDRYVQGGHAADDECRAAGLPDPADTIVHCFREAEISAAEMQSLLAYICQDRDEDQAWHEADRFWDDDDAVGRLENPGECIAWETDDDEPASSFRRPR